MIELIRESDYRKFYIADMSGRKTLLRLLKEQGIFISAPCNGAGSCGSCRVQFLSGAPAPTDKEYRLLQREELAGGMRLACAVHIKEPCQILLLNLAEEGMRILTAGGMPTKEKQAQPEGSGCTSAPKATDACWGLAVDIGTTTLAAELFDLQDGRTLALASGVNHQRMYGADVVTRIAAANAGDGNKLRAIICADIAELISTLLRQLPRVNSVQEYYHAICRIAIVGNTTMCHLLRGLSCEGLARAPFVPTDNSWYETDARTLLGMKHCPAKVTILPGISAFVGADIAAGIFACNLGQNKGKQLLLDIGTNGEMVFVSEGRLYVTSTAAGPVFEGGNISGGMPAVSGAICQVTSGSRQEGAFCFETIDSRQPLGICGTGIIALTGVLLEDGYMDVNGTLQEPWFAKGIPLTSGGIYFQQSDIRQVQMGKAAIRAGIELLLEETEGKEAAAGELTVYLAGGFGHFIDVSRAIQIGMFPPEFKGHVISVGNTALKGAKKYLLEVRSAKAQLTQLLAGAESLQLSLHPAFEEYYIKYMGF